MAEAPGPVQFISLAQLAATAGHRVTKVVSGRSVTVLQHSGHLYALDASCYHLGGPIAEGDIEELGNHTCIVCPWHRRKQGSHPSQVDLLTGAQVDTDLMGAVCASQDVKQRVYPTKLDSSGWIWIDMSSCSETPLPSEVYNCSSQPATSKHGYGLGHRSASGPASGSDLPEPLTPFAGVGRRAMPPSPAKAPQQHAWQAGQQSQAGLPFRAQKTAASMRNANARMAVLRNMKPPPCAATPLQQPRGQPVQRTLQELYSRHVAVTDMET